MHAVMRASGRCHATCSASLSAHLFSATLLPWQAPDAAAAIRVARDAAKVVSSAFPDPVEIKFERVCQPFLLLHVNRWAKACKLALHVEQATSL